MAEHTAQTVAQNRHTSASVSRSPEFAKRQTRREQNELHKWQSALGNQAMQRSFTTDGLGIPFLQRKCAACAKQEEKLHTKAVQAKLAINRPGDAFEQEADRVADTVMRMPEAESVEPFKSLGAAVPPRLQRMCQECEDEKQTATSNSRQSLSNNNTQSNTDPEPDENLQAKEIPGAVPEMSSDSAAELSAFKGSGRMLPQSERRFFEPRFGYDFSNVRIHTDQRAESSARKINALAYTAGSHVVFGEGQYHPETGAGRRLIAHELAHVIQQRSGDNRLPTEIGGGSPKPQIGLTSTAVQRMGDVSQAPKTMACPIATTSSALPVDTNVLFGRGSATLTPTARADLADFAARWNSAGAKQPVRIDGFASTDGGQSRNWILSCQRAQAVGSELESPSGGGNGVAANFIDVFAQGETSEFSRSLELNRRATISADLSVPPPPPCANPGVARDVDVQPVFLRTGPADTTPTGTSWTRRFNEANAIWGKLGVTFHDLGAVTIDTPLKTTGSTVAERDAVAALRTGAGIEVFLVDNDMAAMGGSSEKPGGPVPGCGADGNIVLSDRGTSNTILAHELGHTLGVAHPGGPSHAADANTIMEPSGSNNTENPRRNTLGNFSQIQCPPGTASTCLNPDP
jgi:outer membrane protein OmpA-like peptidoglycan-associated protein